MGLNPPSSGPNPGIAKPLDHIIDVYAPALEILINSNCDVTLLDVPVWPRLTRKRLFHEGRRPALTAWQRSPASSAGVYRSGLCGGQPPGLERVLAPQTSFRSSLTASP
jgi:hypothetical protein